MSDNNRFGDKIKNIIPKNLSGWIGIVTLIIIAFFFGKMNSDNATTIDNHATQDTTTHTEWTCSMHPQIKLPKAGKCPICFMDLIPLETNFSDDLDPSQIRISENAKQLAQIQSVVVRRGFAEAEIRMVGKIAYDERKVSSITAWVPGRLDKLYADYTGMKVNKGDHLVYMYSPELLATQEELLQAKKAIQTLGDTKSKILKQTAEQTLKATREKLSLYGLSDAQIKSIEETNETSDHLTINAPIGGVVVHKNVNEGMYVKVGTPIYTIADLSKLWIHSGWRCSR